MGKTNISQKTFAECSAKPHSDYACQTWYPNLNEKTKKKIQLRQNKCISLCLKLDKIYHISEEEFGLTTRLPTNKRVDQFMNTITYNFVNNTCPYYLNDIFEFAPHCKTGTRNNFSKIKKPFDKKNMGKKQIPILVPLSGTACLTQIKKRLV